MFCGKEGKRIAQITIRKVDEEGIPRGSGSFSVYSSGKKVDLNELIKFLKEKINETDAEEKESKGGRKKKGK